MTELHITVPLVPPSVNEYRGINWRARRFYLKPEAVAFKQAVALYVRGQFVAADAHEVEYTLYLGKGKRMDSDNASKLILDSLADAGVFRDAKGKVVSDASVTDKHEHKRRDHANPRTVITIREAQCQ